MKTVALPPIVARRFVLSGHVQGIGVRPAISRLAKELELAGFVRNTLSGVEVVIEGTPANVAQFRLRLRDELPREAHVVDYFDTAIDAPANLTDFRIVQAEADGSLATRVPPDRAVCPDCLREISEPYDRRRGYAFTSCTQCGPRYSIIRQMPYERDDTSMAPFALCDACDAEYRSASARRFHAQTNACDACGPQIRAVDAGGQPRGVATDALRFAAGLLQSGKILALKGVGGYQLLVDATNDDAVARLRRRKGRPSKPLAVMVRSLTEARALAHVDATEREFLCSPANPIVLLKSRSDTDLSRQIHPGLNVIGVMLPTTPLHALLCREVGVPLVCTSGNGDGDPLAFEESAAEKSLRGICDAWLHHDRPIVHPIDDSVVRVIAGRPVTIRLARGMAPLPLELPTPPEPIVALGGHLKSAIAWHNGRQAVLGPHVGELGTLRSRERFEHRFRAMQQLYRFEPAKLVHDLHPDYFTTTWASQQHMPTMAVQHHYAHILAGMLEHGWLDRTVLGVSWDGTGYGTDGTIWGGEFLIANSHNFRRAACLLPFQLPGGEQCIREPWRTAISTASIAAGHEAARNLFLHARAQADRLIPLLTNHRLAPHTSSAGRLFDAAASIILGVEQTDFEGQAAMLLEATADERATGTYSMTLIQNPAESNPSLLLDWRPMIRQMLDDRQRGVDAGAMAMKFHRAMAEGVVAVCSEFFELSVVLTGGVFQNRLLTELVADRLDSSRQLGLPGVIPPGDGGLAAGQLAAACAAMEA